MDWGTIAGLIDARLIVVLAACWAIGFALKSTPRVPDWSILYIVALLAILLTVWIIGWGPETITQGIIVAAVAVFGHQAVKQAREATGR